MMTLELLLAGERLLLLAQKALYWPARKMLIIADMHFGKAASFRALGVPVPHGTTSHDLALLDDLIAAHEVTCMVFLGDFLHSKFAHAAATMKALQGWRERNRNLHLTLVRGNHDVHAGDPPSSLRIEIVDEPYHLAPFAFCHHPDLALGTSYVMAGHVHPVFRLTSGRASLRLPCFLIGEQRAILPSFGSFTGGFLVTPQIGERLFVTTMDAVFAVPLSNLSQNKIGTR